MGFSFDATTTTGRLARAVAGATQHAGKHVGFPVDHVRIAVASMRDQPDVFGNRGMRRARPLAVNNLVEIVGCADVCWLQNLSSKGAGISPPSDAPSSFWGGLDRVCTRKSLMVPRRGASEKSFVFKS